MIRSLRLLLAAWAAIAFCAPAFAQTINPAPSSGAPVPQYLVVRNQQTSGTGSGDSLTATAWTQLTLNTLVSNTIAGSSLATSTLTLPAGTYRVNGSAPAPSGATNASVQLRVQIQGTGTTLAQGSNYRASGASTGAPISVNGVFVLASSSLVELDMYTTVASTSGVAASSGQAEVYGNLVVEKIA